MIASRMRVFSQEDRQTGRQTDRQTNRQRNTETEADNCYGINRISVMNESELLKWKLMMNLKVQLAIN